MTRSTTGRGAASFRASETISQGQKRAAIGKAAGKPRQKPRRNWKALRASSLPKAMELCLDYAREVQNLGVERIADRMGLASHWVIYKWMEEGGMPARHIRSFEHACGATYVTRYIAASAHMLLIDLPTGRHAVAQDIQAVQEACTAAVGALLAFYSGRSAADETHAALTVALQQLAAERAEVERYTNPELPFDHHE